jgi:hypothetical protein
MSFSFKYPFASDSFAAGGQVDKVPRVTANKGVVFGLNGGKPVCGIKESKGRFIRKGVDRIITGKESRRRPIAVLGEVIFSSRKADVWCDDTARTSCNVVESGRHRRRDGRGR